MLKELIAITIPSKCIFLFGRSIIGTPELYMLSLKQFYIRWPENIPRKHVGANQTCWKDSCWFVETIFTLGSSLRRANSVTKSLENAGAIKFQIWIPNSSLNLGLGALWKFCEKKNIGRDVVRIPCLGLSSLGFLYLSLLCTTTRTLFCFNIFVRLILW